MNSELRRQYRNAQDYLTYVKLSAPDFPPSDNLTVERALERIRSYLDALSGQDNHPDAKIWLRVCATQVGVAEKLFHEGKNSEARKALDSARAYLQNANERKSTKATFSAETTGFAE